MEENKAIEHNLAFKITCGALLFVALFMSGLILGLAEGTELFTAGLYFVIAMLMLSAYETILWFVNRETEGKFAQFRLYRLACFIIAIILTILGSVSEIFFVCGGIVYLFTPCIRRISSLVKNHKKRNVIFNIILGGLNLFILIMGISTFSLGEDRNAAIIALVGFVLLMSCLFHIGLNVFSSFNLGLLKKIIKKTYAGEILFGLLLLICSFSAALVMLEPNITSFGDALWYCFAIVTTIGFGDLVSVSILGRLLSVILGVYGLIVVAIITSIIVNFYNEVKTTDDEDDAKTDKTTAVTDGTSEVKAEDVAEGETKTTEDKIQES